MALKHLAFVIDSVFIPISLYFITISSIDIHNGLSVLYCQKPIAITNIVVGIIQFTLSIISIALYPRISDLYKQGLLRLLWGFFYAIFTVFNGVFMCILALQNLFVYCIYGLQPVNITISLLTMLEIVYRMIAYYQKPEFWRV